MSESETNPPLAPKQEGDDIKSESGEEESQKILDEARAIKEEGNALYKKHDFEAAAERYSAALEALGSKPWKKEYSSDAAIFLANRAACKIAMNNAADAAKDCTEALDANPAYERARWRRAEAYEATSRPREASDDYAKLAKEAAEQTAKEKAEASLRRLEPAAKEQQERELQDMLGKLKELGNGILGKFGLSTDNFKMDKDPTTGSYSFRFAQNPGQQS